MVMLRENRFCFFWGSVSLAFASLSLSKYSRFLIYLLASLLGNPKLNLAGKTIIRIKIIIKRAVRYKMRTIYGTTPNHSKGVVISIRNLNIVDDGFQLRQMLSLIVIEPKSIRHIQFVHTWGYHCCQQDF